MSGDHHTVVDHNHNELFHDCTLLGRFLRALIQMTGTGRSFWNDPPFALFGHIEHHNERGGETLPGGSAPNYKTVCDEATMLRKPNGLVASGSLLQYRLAFSTSLSVNVQKL